MNIDSNKILERLVQEGKIRSKFPYLKDEYIELMLKLKEQDLDNLANRIPYLTEPEKQLVYKAISIGIELIDFYQAQKGLYKIQVSEEILKNFSRDLFIEFISQCFWNVGILGDLEFPIPGAWKEGILLIRVARQ